MYLTEPECLFVEKWGSEQRKREPRENQANASPKNPASAHSAIRLHPQRRPIFLALVSRIQALTPKSDSWITHLRSWREQSATWKPVAAPFATWPEPFSDEASHEKYSEDLFEKLADHSPAQLIRLVQEGRLKDTDLTFAAEAIGRIRDHSLAVPALRHLLAHPAAVVREGALYGLSRHLTAEVERLIGSVAESDNDPCIREVARDILA